MPMLDAKLAVLIPAALLILSACDNSTTAPPSAAEPAAGAAAEPATAQPANPVLPASLLSKAPADARVFFVEPANGATVGETFTVRFGLNGMAIAPAGEDRPNTGHHHILIDLDELPDMSIPLPATEQIVHYGGGQTEATLTLPPGEHSLQLLLGNYVHIPHDNPVISEKITITVE
ncbi:MAG: DUF4399 domain-containing protein [Pseudomonadota bacterium]